MSRLPHPFALPELAIGSPVVAYERVGIVSDFATGIGFFYALGVENGYGAEFGVGFQSASGLQLQHEALNITGSVEYFRDYLRYWHGLPLRHGVGLGNGGRVSKLLREAFGNVISTEGRWNESTGEAMAACVQSVLGTMATLSPRVYGRPVRHRLIRRAPIVQRGHWSGGAPSEPAE